MGNLLSHRSHTKKKELFSLITKAWPYELCMIKWHNFAQEILYEDCFVLSTVTWGMHAVCRSGSWSNHAV